MSLQNADELPVILARCPHSSFLLQLAKIGPAAKMPTGDRICFVTAFLGALDITVTGQRESAYRLNSVVSKLNLTGGALDGLSDSMKDGDRLTKSLLVSALPLSTVARLRLGLTSPDTLTINETVSTEPASTQADAPIDGVRFQESGLIDVDYAVLLLATVDNQSSNKKLLEGEGYGVFRIDTVTALEQVLAESGDVCACLIDGSFLNPLSESDQLRLLEIIANYSSLIWIRVDESALKISRPEVRSMLKHVWCRSDKNGFDQMSFQPTGTLRDSELPEIKQSRNALGSSRIGRFLPQEISDREATLLMAVASGWARDWKSVASVSVVTVGAKFLSGGRTDSRIALIRINEREIPLVVKIASREAIQEESRRFLTFIEKWDDRLSPQTYIHNGCGMMLFRLVSSDEHDADPAPTLEDRLKRLWWKDLYPLQRPGCAPDPGDLTTAIAHATEKLQRLNIRACSSPDFDSISSPRIDCFDRFDNDGLELGYSSDCHAARGTALERFQELDGKAVVHGDVNLRNVLVTGDRSSFFIDYANSGPGHPVIDLVRFELALYLGVFKPFGLSTRCLELQTALTLGLVNRERLFADFPDLAHLNVNRVCLEGMILIRDAALDVVSKHGGDVRDYIATKYLVAWQSLLVEGLDVGLAKTIIDSLTDEIIGWK